MNRSRRTNTLVFTREQHVNRLRLPDSVMLMPERGDAWTNRMEVLSSSGKRYVIAQHR